MAASETIRVSVKVGESVVKNLGDLAVSGPSGVVWGLDSPQLNANLVSLEAGSEIADHVNNEVDVLLAVSGGKGRVVINDAEREISADSIVLIPRGSRRSVHADSALVYLSIHTRRDGLAVGSRR